MGKKFFFCWRVREADKRRQLFVVGAEKIFPEFEMT
jgi:hypothetical protein